MAPYTIQRRRFPRRKFHGPAGIIHRGKYEVGEGLEISEGGMLVSDIAAAKVGHIIVVSFFVPGRDFVTLHGEILYKKKVKTPVGPLDAMGVKFINLQFAEQRFIRDYIADKSTVEVAFE